MSFRFFIILTFILVGRPQDIFSFLIPFRLALIFTLGALLLTFIGKKESSFLNAFSAEESKKYLLIFVIMIAGIPFASHKGLAFEYVFKVYVSNVIYFYLFITHVRSFQRLKTVLFTLCVSAFEYSLFCMLQGSISTGGRLVTGAMFDPNDLAYFFVSLLPISFIFLFKGEVLVKKMIAGSTVLISVVMILMTGSRGGFIGLTTIICLFLFTDLGFLQKRYKTLLIIGLIIISFAFADKINIDRFKSIFELKNDYNITAEMGRLDIWETGLKLLMRNPLTGVGVNCFGFAIGSERQSVGDIPRWQTAHNSFVQFGVEVGLIGMGVFILLIVSCFKTFSFCRRMEPKENFTDGYQFRKVGGLLQIAFSGQLVCSLFLSQAYSTILTVFLCLSAVMRYLSGTYNEV